MLISDASLLSDKKYLNFEIKFDWKIEKGGNSGFMWGVDENLNINSLIKQVLKFKL